GGWTQPPTAYSPPLGSRGMASASGDVFDQLGALLLELLDADLDHVTDTHNAAQVAVLHHRKVADTPFGHGPHERLRVVAGGAGVDRRGHDGRDQLVLHGTAAGGHGADDVTFGDDAVDGDAVVGDDQGADPVPAQL